MSSAHFDPAFPAPKIFISYKRDHQPSADLIDVLDPALRGAGFEVLWDNVIPAGESWPDELWEWLLTCSGAVVVLSEEALESDWCRHEHKVLMARNSVAGLRVVPVAVDDSSPTSDRNILGSLQAVTTSADDMVSAVLEGLDGVLSSPMSAEDYLAAHQAWLSWQFNEESTLGREPFSLADVYTDTDCGVLEWRQIKGDDDSGPVDPFSLEAGGRQPLVSSVMAKIADPDFRDLLVVQGPAGSGKSSFTLRLANELIESGLVPMLVRFRDLRLSTHGDRIDELLQDALRVAPVNEHPPKPIELIFDSEETATIGKAEINRIVVILDGWDEVALTGNTSFKNQLTELLPKLREFFVRRPGKPIRLVLTGRPTTDVAGSGVLLKETPVLTMRPFTPNQVRSYADRVLAKVNEAEQAGWTLQAEQFEPALAQYDKSHNSQRGSGFEVLGSPLLALLAMRTVAESPDNKQLFQEPTALYHALIDITSKHSGKAKDEGLEGTVHRGGQSLRRLLQEIAAIISILGQESVSSTELNLRIGEEALRKWAETTTDGDTLQELVVNFYFKSHPDLGCEFLHKSFREYLFAESIVATLEEINSDRTGELEPPRIDYWQDFEEGSPHYDASRRLARLLGPQWLTHEVQQHLWWLLGKNCAAHPEVWRSISDLLVDIYGWWFEGVHLRQGLTKKRGRREQTRPPVVAMVEDMLPYDDSTPTVPPRTTVIDSHLGDALLRITSHVRDQLQTQPIEQERAYLNAFRFAPAPSHGPQLLARINSGGWGPTRFHLPAVSLSEANLVKADLEEANLEGADLGGADLFGADLGGANLEEANLEGADLEGTNLEGTNLEKANLREANLEGAHIKGTNLKEADLEKADIRRGDLRQAHIREANLREANLEGAHIKGAHLKGANLEGANLEGANLEGANLEGAGLGGAGLKEANLKEAHIKEANLRRANLRRANLEKANLSEANLSEANLKEANLKEANLEKADLRGADLRGADLRGADLRGADLDRADLRGADLDRADLDGAYSTGS